METGKVDALTEKIMKDIKKDMKEILLAMAIEVPLLKISKEVLADCLLTITKYHTYKNGLVLDDIEPEEILK